YPGLRISLTSQDTFATPRYHQRRSGMFSRASALAVLIVAGAAVAIPALSASGEVVQTISFKEVNKGSTFNYVDNRPVNKPHKRPTFSPGDEFVFTSPIND